MAEEGWTLRIVGDGAERTRLERSIREERIEAVTFAGWVSDVGHELARSGIFVATAPSDSFGLGVVEAMAAGIPVAACASGGHLETIGELRGAKLFGHGDVESAAEALRSFLSEAERVEMSARQHELVTKRFTIARHVDELLLEYERAIRDRRDDNRHRERPRPRSRSSSGHERER
jgi:glycosyltransferase involved in cell wall biosynthesis